MSNEPMAWMSPASVKYVGKTDDGFAYHIITTSKRTTNHSIPLYTQDDTALLRQALEALEAGDWYIDQLEMIVYSDDDTGINGERAKVQAAITALRERLALSDAALLAPKPGQLKDRGQE